MSKSRGSACAAMRTSSCATATPSEVLGATSTAMSRAAAATRASNSAPCPVVPIRMGTRAARATFSRRNERSGREKSIATCAAARSDGNSSTTRTPLGATPASSPMSRPRDLLPDDATADTISSCALSVAQMRTIAVPMRPVAPINTALVIDSSPAARQCAAAPPVMRDCRPMIRIGILGAARIAPRGIVTPANELLGAEVVAVASRDLDRARDFAAQHSIPYALGSYAELVTRDDVDLVYVPLPPSAHLEWCTAALVAGKHVLVEKPFANNAQDAAQMVATARAAGRHLLEGFHYRFHPLFGQALVELRRGTI